MNKLNKEKKRIDQILIERNLVESRNKAQGLILTGKVFVNDKVVKKPGEIYKKDISVKISNKKNWVSRGALKIEPIIIKNKISIKDKICLDIGSSTGGFTEVLLNLGAKKIYAIDVGYNQLHERIKSNKNVVNLEKTNARYLDCNIIKEKADLIVCDASFISLIKVIEKPIEFLKENGLVIALIKPQFESTRKHIKKGGVVKDPEIHNQVCQKINNWFVLRKFQVISIDKSPLIGPKGNIEFFIIALKNS